MCYNEFGKTDDKINILFIYFIFWFFHSLTTSFLDNFTTFHRIFKKKNIANQFGF